MSGFALLSLPYRTKLSPNRRFTWFIVVFLMPCFIGCSAGKVMKEHPDFRYTILRKGTGPKAKVGQEILLLETTRYKNGTILYSNEYSTNPVKVLIGGNQATQAVDKALVGMKVGEIKEIIAPHYLVKRKFYPPNVHPDSTLVIKLILHKIL